MSSMPKAAKRSACDRCRAKRVRCLRAEGSTEPCARCVRVAAACVTGSPGYPGRPRKALVDRDSDDLALLSLHRPVAEDEPMSVEDTPAMWFGADTSLNLLDDLGGAVHPPKGAFLFQDHSDPWSVVQGGGSLFGFPLTTEENSASDSIPTQQQLSTVSHHQELLSGADSLDITYAGLGPNNMLDVDFLDSFERRSNPSPAQCLSATSSLMRFGEKMERRISAMGDFFSDARHTVEDCVNSGDMATENPVAVAIMYTKEFTDIIQNLMASTRSSSSSSSNQLISPTASSAIRPEPLSTETTLLVLSCYLQLMRLYDSLFRDAYRCLCQISSETISSIKVKAVFRIGGISSLQDLSGKVYAKGVVEVIQSHIQTLEGYMGLPAVYCLSSEVTTASPKGIFADVDRARLLHAVMAQEDVRSVRGNKSYVESIRENIKNSVAIFGN